MRAARRAEAEAFRETLEGYDHGLATAVQGAHALAVVEEPEATWLCLSTPEALALPKELLEGAAGGLPVGVLEDGAFHLTLQGAVRVARHTRRRCVRVNEHASRLALYGRTILADSVEAFDATLQKGEPCIVTNPRGEAVAMGVVVGSLKGRGEAVRVLHDLGTYLRDQDEAA
jgi:ribosome biogenesis protein Nip4